jgi:hypothetical protein
MPFLEYVHIILIFFLEFNVIVSSVFSKKGKNFGDVMASGDEGKRCQGCSFVLL